MFAQARPRARRALRHTTLSALSAGAAQSDRVRMSLSTPRVHFAYLHAVPVHEEPTFRRLLAYLSEGHDLVGHSEAVRRLRSGVVDRPTISFSFDDAFASNHRTGAILEEFGTRGMFFVPGFFPGTNTLEDARHLFGYSQNITEPAMSWDQVADLVDRGHEIGNHTSTHRDLAKVPHDEVIRQIEHSASVLQERVGRCPHFAWPFGRRTHITPEGIDATFAAGHETCASAERGSHSASDLPAEAPLVLLRDHLMTSWPLEHNLYFLAQSAERPVAPWSHYPQEWT